MLFTMAIPVVTLAGIPQVATSPASATEDSLPPGEIVLVGQDAYENTPKTRPPTISVIDVSVFIPKDGRKPGVCLALSN
jgi:hypothetical protein